MESNINTEKSIRPEKRQKPRWPAEFTIEGRPVLVVKGRDARVTVKQLYKLFSQKTPAFGDKFCMSPVNGLVSGERLPRDVEENTVSRQYLK